MMSCNCNCGCASRCSLWALILAAVAGVLTAFLQITGVVVLTTAFLWVALGIGVGYLALLVLTGTGTRRADRGCCRTLELLLAALLGTIALALVLLAVGITATSILSAILAGGLVFFLVLVFAGSACYVRCLGDCGS